MTTAIVTSRIGSNLLERLDELGKRSERSRAWLAAKAIERYVDEELARLDFIQEGLDDLEHGRFLTQEEMEAWFEARSRPIAAE